MPQRPAPEGAGASGGAAAPRRRRRAGDGPTAEQVAGAVQAACLLELQAFKPGNARRGGDLPGLTYRDLVLSATAIGPAFRRLARGRIGRLVLQAVRDTRRHVRTNTNLGIILMLAPLARAALLRGGPLRARLRRVLRNLDRRDARDVYGAIRLARPGGLGRVARQDVRSTPTATLLDCMRLAAARDAVAREYATDYRTVFEIVLPALRRLRARRVAPPVAIAQAYLTLLAARPDTLITRKAGPDEAREVSRQAARALAAGGMLAPRGRALAERLDRRLRRARPPLNPGATADLTVAALCVLILETTTARRGPGATTARRAGHGGRTRPTRRG
jgi:triphosphoribosyl-dephospho-CoA synthase